jgi:replicative DNA helicase
MDVEKALLSKSVQEKTLLPVLDAKITYDFFIDEEHREIFMWMLRHREDYGVDPGIEALGHEYPNFKLAKVEEPWEYYIHEMRDQRRSELLQTAIQDTREPLEEGDTQAAANLLGAALEKLHTDTNVASDEDWSDTGKKRLLHYNNLAANRGQLLGVTTGFPSLDLATSGLQKEQLITFVGQPKSGKSAFLMLMAIAANESAHKTMSITFEMSNQEQAARHDAFRAHISYNRVVNGNLTREEQERLKQMVRRTSSMRSMVSIHDPSSATTVSAISAKVAQHQPDILFVDGVYLMEAEIPDVTAGSALALISITRGLKKLAQRHQIPVVCSTQVLERRFNKTSGTTLGSIGYTSSFGQDSDLVLAAEPEDKEVPHERKVRIVAGRNTSYKEIRVRWDWERGEFPEIGQGEGDTEGFEGDGEDENLNVKKRAKTSRK